MNTSITSVATSTSAASSSATTGEATPAAIAAASVEQALAENSDRFYRADRARVANAGKMGLGLAISKALVTAQGGVISAESAGKGQGITMVITLNSAPEQEEEYIMKAG